MNTKIKKVGLILVGILLVVVSLVIASDFLPNEYILIEIQYDNGNFVLIDKSLEKGNFPTINHDLEQRYEVRLISDEEEVLFSNYFDPTILYSDGYEEEMEGGMIELDEARFFIITPNFKNAKKVEILEDKNKVFETEVYDVGSISCKIK